jgi:hypothetical protein
VPLRDSVREQKLFPAFEPAMARSNKTMVFYTMQGEPGEDPRHPNAFMIKGSGRKLRQKDVLKAFPLLKSGIGTYHVRFRAPSRSSGNPKGYVYEDVSDDPSVPAPVHNGVIFLKVLRLDSVSYDLELSSAYADANASSSGDEAVHAYGATSESSSGSSSDSSSSSESEDGYTEDLIGDGAGITRQPSLDTFFSSPSAKDAKDAKIVRQKKGKKQKKHKQSRRSRSGSGTRRPSRIAVHDEDDDGDGDMMCFSPKAGQSPTDAFSRPEARRQMTFEEEMASIGTSGGGNVEQIIQSRLQEIKLEDTQAAAVAEEKMEIEHDISKQLDAWAKDGGGKFKAIRTLLGTLHNVIYEGAKWKEVGMSDLIQPRKVKISYFKAVRIVHPDKLPEGATTRTKVIAERIFEAINKSWKEFEAKEM